jgi:hypothetical protein
MADVAGGRRFAPDVDAGTVSGRGRRRFERDLAELGSDAATGGIGVTCPAVPLRFCRKYQLERLWSHCIWNGTERIEGSSD